jgi:acyl phosphate:glycerol-3-phosphate acyltransferase
LTRRSGALIALVDFRTLAYVASACYLCGSIPTAYIFGRLIKGIDIRKVGSGNVGASNAMRLLGKGWGITILLIDALKGLIPLLLLIRVLLKEDPQLMRYAMTGALSAMVGHVFPVWLAFRGGKGVATGLGVMVALVPLTVAVTLPVFILTVALTRIISLGSIMAALALPGAFFIDHNLSADRELFAFVVIACIFVIYKHKTNIKRIISGEENRLGANKPDRALKETAR